MNSLIGNSKDSLLPKYQRVERAILNHIRRSKLKPGDRLPGERSLAELTGVSAVTASRGINQLVLRGILERRQGHGTFVTNLNPHGEKSGTKHVGLITRYGAGDHYQNEIVHGITNALNDDGYKLLIMASDADYHLPSLREYNLAGLIAISPPRNRIEELQHIRELLVPLVMVGYRYPELDAITFSCDDYAGGKLAVEYLAGLGHRRIGVLGTRGNPPSEERMAGFRKGMFEAGLPFDPEWEVLNEGSGPAEQADPLMVERFTRLLVSPGRPSAVFATSPRLLLSAYAAAKDANLAIPHQLSLIGFDEMPHGAYVSPAPTVLRQPLIDIGMAVGQAMLAALGGQEAAISMRLPATLIERESCERPNA